MAEEKTKRNDGLSGFSMENVSGINQRLQDIESQATSDVYSKQAKRYESQGEGAVLRTQRNIANLFGPAFNLYNERKAIAEETFVTNLENSPEVDDTKIFGDQTNTPMPITEEVMGLSKTIREDLRMLSNLNRADERYEPLRKKIEKNQGVIVKFNEVNEKLYSIRNSEPVKFRDWTDGMKAENVRMWNDIYNSNGGNIKIIDGVPTYVDMENGKQIRLDKIGDSPTVKNSEAVNEYNENFKGVVDGYSIQGGTMDNTEYSLVVGGAFRFLDRLNNDSVRSLLFDGYGLTLDQGAGPVTTDFLNDVIQRKYGEEIDTPEELLEKLENLKEIGVNLPEFTDKDGKSASLKDLFIQYEKDNAVKTIQDGSATTVFGGNKNEPSTSVNFQKSITSETGEIKSSITMPTVTLPKGNKQITYDSPELYFRNGIPYIKLDESGDESSIISFDKKPTEMIDYLQEQFKGATKDQIIKYVNSQIDKSKKDFSTTNSRLNKLKRKGVNFGTGIAVDDYLLTFGDEKKVINSLNDEYKDLGFTFRYNPANPEAQFLTDLDELIVQHENFPGENFKIRFDTATEKTDLKRTDDLIAVMKALLNRDLTAAKSVKKGINFKN